MKASSLRVQPQNEQSFPPALLYNGLAIAYSVLGYLFGWYAILHSSLVINIAGTLLLGHSIVIAAYLIHDCAHKAILKTAERNARLGRMLNWITGACYGKFEDLRAKHMRHHVDNADVVELDTRKLLEAQPWLRKTIWVFEYFHIPAFDILMHGVLMFAPWIFSDKTGQRTRTSFIIIIRTAFFVIVALVHPIAILWYCLAVFFMLHVLRFMDAFQHNYPLTVSLTEKSPKAKRQHDTEYEFKHTFSNLLSQRYPAVNLLVLNFCYHNAHHTKPTVPWYQLPRLHKALYPDGCAQTVTFTDQLRCYHQNRLERIWGGNEENEDFIYKLNQGKAIGANGVSFLTAF